MLVGLPYIPVNPGIGQRQPGRGKYPESGGFDRPTIRGGNQLFHQWRESGDGADLSHPPTVGE